MVMATKRKTKKTPAGLSPEETIDALQKWTQLEINALKAIIFFTYVFVSQPLILLLQPLLQNIVQYWPDDTSVNGYMIKL